MYITYGFPQTIMCFLKQEIGLTKKFHPKPHVHSQWTQSLLNKSNYKFLRPGFPFNENQENLINQHEKRGVMV